MGRTKAFDVDHALDQALRVFWEKGYEGASLPDLTQAMGINRPSLYATFGNKEMLFRKVLQRYAEGPGGFIRKSLEEPSSKLAVKKLLHAAIEMQTDRRNPKGCLMVHGALACGATAEAIRGELAAWRKIGERAMEQRFKQAKLEGDLPESANPADLARLVATVVQGMAVQAAGGASRAELQRVADLVLLAWPGVR